MSNNYISYHFTISPKEIGSEILIAELGELPFESFIETETGIDAFIQKNEWHINILDDIQIIDSEEFKIQYTYEEIEQVNWNEEWEKNFEPIDVRNLCYIRAPFHQKTDAKYDIVIEPKMSFGTGHHETTYMMIDQLLDLEVTDKATLDMGCGTAILAILASMKGANPVDAIDIDKWCYLNSIENIERNNCSQIQVYEGDASLLNEQKYDLIIANINRNILLRDIEIYNKTLNNNGFLLLSGFYEEDFEAIDNCCTTLGLKFIKKYEKNNWISLRYQK